MTSERRENDDTIPLRGLTSPQGVPRETELAYTHYRRGDRVVTRGHLTGQKCHHGTYLPGDPGDFMPLFRGKEPLRPDRVCAGREAARGQNLTRGQNLK